MNKADQTVINLIGQLLIRLTANDDEATFPVRLDIKDSLVLRYWEAETCTLCTLCVHCLS